MYFVLHLCRNCSKIIPELYRNCTEFGWKFLEYMYIYRNFIKMYFRLTLKFYKVRIEFFPKLERNSMDILWTLEFLPKSHQNYLI